MIYPTIGWLVSLMMVSIIQRSTSVGVPLATGDALSGLWPRPSTGRHSDDEGGASSASFATGTTPLQLHPTQFSLVSTAAQRSPRLTRLMARYTAILFAQKSVWARSNAPRRTVPLTRVALIVPLTTELDRPPALGDDEGFRLWVNATHGGEVHATTYSGLHRGLEAFAQLTIVLGDALVINSTTVHVASAPLFPYRGLMVDTARHFEPIPTLLQLLDGMAASSLNTFHWHLTDAQAFPWNSTAEPRLIQGAYRPDLTYQRADLEAIVAFAADRAIRVVVEIDMPGHAASWAIGRPDVVVDCPPDNAAPLFDGSYQSASQLDPSTNATFELLDALIGELIEIFPDKSMHFGGDEVRMQCFNSSAKVRAFMKSMGFSTGCPPPPPPQGQWRGLDLNDGPALSTSGACDTGVGFKQLTAYLIGRVHELARQHGRTPSGWQEIFDHYGGTTSATPTPPFDGLLNDTVIYDWLAPEWGWANPGTIVASGFQVVSTLGLYLSSDTDNANWEEYYNLHLLTSTLNTTVPHGRGFFNITDPTEISRVLGGEGCLWGEQTNGDVINVRLWPRAAAIAEALWSGPGGNTTEALPRLLRHRCRMRQRGVPVAPLQPGFC